MTRDEARAILAGRYIVNIDGEEEYCEKVNEAIDMAISALTDQKDANVPTEPSTTNHENVQNCGEQNHENVRNEDANDSDLISRADVLGYIDRLKTCGLGKGKALEYFRKYVEKTDSVSAEPKRGEWKPKPDGFTVCSCSECGSEEVVLMSWMYCPYCGAKMGVSE